MSARLLIAGYFGCGNLGDDAILLGFLKGLDGRSVDINVLSGAPEETYRNYGVPSVPRKDPGAVKQAIQNCDALVFAGGSIFQDSTSIKSVAYYSQLIKEAKKAGKKVVLLGQGIGPLTTFLGKKMAVSALNLADGIAVRDPASATALRNLGVKVQPRATADLAFLLPKPVGDENVSNFQVGDMSMVGIAPRPFGKDKEMVQMFGGLTRLLFENKFMPVLIEMDREHDGPLILEIEKTQGGKVPDIRKLQTPMQLQGRLARMDAVIAMRLHAGILAATVGVPPFMVTYDPKVSAFASQMDLPPALNAQGLTAQRLFDSFSLFIKDRERYLRAIERKRAEMATLAQSNIQFLVDLVPAMSR